ncbi:hypothetical protein K3495_g5957 [Podosphaera aphanis]|nr:hypothetical protein K3495_g5957 [Podosphaera aphanis]
MASSQKTKVMDLAIRTLGIDRDPSVRKNMKFNWLLYPQLETLSPFQKFFLNVDWNLSPVGPIEGWPVQLRQMVALIIYEPSPAIIYWGDDPRKQTIIYNEAYIQFIGPNHPRLQGQDARLGYKSSCWDSIEQQLALQHDTAQTVVKPAVFTLLRREGFLEETYFNWKFLPIICENGWVVGSHTTLVEVTRDVIQDRRTSVVRALGRELSGASDIKDLWRRVIAGIQEAEKDIPLALLYSTPRSEVPKLSIMGQRKKPSLTLEGTIGIPTDHSLAQSCIDLENDHTFLADALEKTYTERSANIIPVDENWQKEFSGITWRGFEIPSHTLVVFPIIPTGSRKVLALLLIGLNPRRPFNDIYSSFLTSLIQQVTTPQLSAVLLREEVLARRNLALEHVRVSKELVEAQNRFGRFANRAPVGLAILKPDGKATIANNLWREITRLEVGSGMADWEGVLIEGEFDSVVEAWSRLIKEKKPVTIYSKIKKPWKTPELDDKGRDQWDDTSILVVLHPDFNDNGEIDTVMSCITDISELKWSEAQLRNRMHQAIELKQQQERFVDMTSFVPHLTHSSIFVNNASHEMRNPLSALISCADEIVTSLNEFLSRVPLHSSGHKVECPLLKNSPSHVPIDISNSTQLIEESLEAANTIIYCAMHQKRIIDDILTLSRLDSGLLLVSPEPSQPISLVRSMLKMFEAELKRACTSLQFIEGDSIRELDINWTLLDPSRVLQVLINLITNAIKFTRAESRREITITIEASLSEPSENNVHNMQYVRRSNSALDQTTKPEWGPGESLFLSIAVVDTGKGLTQSEMSNLFNLFAQASPKTHQTYGGSGLGLFISKQLVEMQGGRIGVVSTAGQGSTFQFYIKTFRTNPVSSPTPKGIDMQLLTRQDALRQACASEIITHISPIEEKAIDDWPPIGLKQGVNGKESLGILVVEDNVVNQRVLCKQLNKAGHNVYIANHGEEALSFIRTSIFWTDSNVPVNGSTHSNQSKPTPKPLHVVLMDLEMPIMNGTTCVRRIREEQKSGKIKGHLPVVAVTANARKDHVMECLEAGMDDVMTKPYRITDMLSQIKRVAARYPAPHYKDKDS